nr:MAG TPA: hypothetical protein [Caudoviricetes sp.]
MPPFRASCFCCSHTENHDLIISRRFYCCNIDVSF